MTKKINDVAKYVFLIILLIAMLLMVGMLLKGGLAGGEQNALGGPFESSGSTSRYALVGSIVETNSLFLSEEQARFASPDVSKLDGRYFSLFTPGVSFLGVPFYILGRQLGAPQLGAYSSTALLAVFNALLVAKIARKIGARTYTALLSGALFLFGTNALAYALTLTQHHASAFVILLAILSAFGKRSFINNIWFGVLFGLGILIDVPNAMMMAPLTIYVLAKQFESKRVKGQILVSLKLNFVGMLIGLLPLLGIMGWYNYSLTGSYSRLPQFVGRFTEFEEEEISLGKPVEENGVILPFNSRNQLHGLYIFAVSDERGLPIYTPMVLFGIAGLYMAYKKKAFEGKVVVISAVALMNVVVYTLFSDPTGSWAFGPRYLIPGIAILSTGIGVAVDRFRYSIVFFAIFLIVAVYSVGVNVIGAMTTTQVPPKIEAVALADPIPYTYEYNWQLLSNDNINASLFYNSYLVGKWSSIDFAAVYILGALGLITIIYLAAVFEESPRKS